MLAALLVTPMFASSTRTALAANGQPGAVYIMTNSAGGNAVVAFNRSADGSLSEARTYSTGGLGSGEWPWMRPFTQSLREFSPTNQI